MTDETTALISLQELLRAFRGQEPLRISYDAWDRKAAFPLRQPDDDTWQRLLRLADSEHASTRRQFLEAITKLRESADIEAITEALSRGDFEAVLAAIDFDALKEALDAIEEALEPLREKAFTVGTESAIPHLDQHQLSIHLRPGAQLAVRFGQISDHVRQAIQRGGASRMVDITSETAAAVRQLVERAYVAGKAPKTIVKELRTTIGLTRRQEAAVAKYAAAIATDNDVPAARAQKMVDRYRAKLLKQRAERVARTETQQAMNDGQRAAWSSLVEKGLLDPNRFEREWMAIVPSDGRTCATCEELDGTRAPIGGKFPDPGDEGPPQHPDCRCVEKLVPKGDDS